MMKKGLALILLLAMFLEIACAAFAADPQDLQGYQKKTKTWQYIHFGTYPTEADGTEQLILWRVLGVKDEKAYLLSEYILFAHRVDPNCYPTNKATAPYGGWETSELFGFLNTDFLNAAFTAGEQVVLSELPDGGRVSLPEIQDIKNESYGFGSNKVRQAQSTAYAKANGLYVYQGAKQYSPYWSRTRSDSKQYAHRRVMDDGKLGYICVEVQNLGVRPVILLDMSKVDLLTGAGTIDDPYMLAFANPTHTVDPADTPADEGQDEPAADEPDEEQPDEPDKTETAAEEVDPAENVPESDVAQKSAGTVFSSDYDELYPALTEEGFLPAGEPEFVYRDKENGLWLYAGQDLRVEIVRYREQKPKNRPWRWYVADIYVRPGSDEFMKVFYMNQDPKSKKEVEINKIAQQNHLVFAMNSDWYHYRVKRNAKRKVMPVGIIIRQNQVLYDDPAKSLWKTIPNRDILALYPDGNVEVYDYNGATAEELLQKGAYDVLSFGPVLLSEGQITKQTTDISARQQDNPRSGIGMVEPGHYVSIVMEGRRRGVSNGCTVEEFAELFQSKGCQVAYNLDGGGTASMMFMGEYVNAMGSYTENARKQVEVLGIGISDQVQ